MLDAVCGLLAAGAALLGAVVVLRLWDAQLHVPLSILSGDVTDSLMVVKMLSGGAWFQNDLIGAPTGTAMEDYPFFWDLGQVLGIKGLGVFSSDPAAIFNASFVLSFPAIALNAFVSLRWIGSRRGPAVVAAVLFALLPFHFLRGQAHFYIAQYWAVPFSAALVYKLIAGQPLVLARAGASGFRRWLTPTTLFTLGAATLSGVQFGYYAIFTLVLVALVAVVRFAAAPGRRTLLEPTVVLLTTGFFFALMLLPTLLYRLGNGTNALVASRTPNEAEIYGFKLSQLLLPIGEHRVEAFADKAAEYATSAPQLGEGPSTPALGLLLGFAFIASFVTLVVAAIRSAPVTGQAVALRTAGLGALLCFLLGTVGGGSSLFAYLLSPQLRGWGRISVFLAFFTAVALCAILTWALHERRRVVAPRLAVGALVVLGVLGVLDQTSETYAPDYRTNLVSWRSDSRFVKQIEKQVADDGAILQLPYQAFPEAPSQARATDFDLFRPLLHSDRLRWSYGAMKGRPDDFGAVSVLGRPLAQVVPEAAAAGFAGVYVDTYFYDDGGQSVLRELTAVSGQQPIRSDDGRMAFVSLATTDARLASACSAATTQRSADSFLHPVRADWGRGFYPQETNGSDTWHWATGQATLTLTLPKARTTDGKVNFSLRGATGAAQTIVVQIGSQPATRYSVRRGGATPVSILIPAAQEQTVVRLATSAPDDGLDPRELRMQVANLDGLDELGCAER